MSFRLLPKDVKFFDLFVADGENLQAAATKLRDLIETFDDLDARIAEIQLLEKRGDDIDREINQRLEDAFVTPFDREDIHDLTIQLDDVVDGIQWSPRRWPSTASTGRPRRPAARPDPGRPG